MTNDGVVCPNEVKNPCLFKLLISPNEQFRRLKQRTKILVPLFIVTLFMVIGMILSTQGMDLIRDDRELLQMTGAELAIFLFITQVIAALIAMMTPVILIFITSIIYYLIANIVKSSVSFRQLFAMNTFLFLPTALHIFVNGIGFFLFGEIHGYWTVFTSLNILFGKTGLLGTVLIMLEIFTIWGAFLMWKGLRIVAEFSKLTTAIIIVISLLLSAATILLLA